MAQKLSKRLVAEFKRGGKKTIVLGLLVLVGLYFWVPMLWKRGDAKPVQKSPTAATTQTKPAAPPPAAEQPAKSGRAPDWKALRSRVESAAVTHPTDLDDLVRDPFDREWIRQKTPTAAAPKTDPTPNADPIKRLACSSILLGPDYRAAIIGEHTYRVGEMVPRDEPSQYQYLLKEVRDDRVLLERDGDIVELEIPKPRVQ